MNRLRKRGRVVTSRLLFLNKTSIFFVVSFVIFGTLFIPQSSEAAECPAGETYVETISGAGEHGEAIDITICKNASGQISRNPVEAPPGRPSAGFIADVLEFVGQTLLQITSFLAAMTGKLLDASIKFSLTIGNDDVMKTVKAGWVVFRDFANMFFIFALLYIAFATMLQISNFDTKRVLAKLVVVGLLLNFSLFFSSIVIDVSNVLAYTLYKNVATQGTTGWTKSSLSEPFVTKFGLTGIYTVGKGGIDFTKKENVENLWVVMLMGGIFIFIVAFIFLIAAAVFLIRAVKLIFLMLLSPLAFIAFILPGTEQYAKKWWTMLLGESFVAPMFLLFIYVTLKMASGLSLSPSEGLSRSLAKEFSQLGEVEIIFRFALLSGLMIASVIFAKDLSKGTAEMAMSWAQKGTRLAGKNTLGLAGSGIAAGGAWLGKKGYAKWNRVLNFTGTGLRDRSYDVGHLPGASGVGLTQLKDMKNFGQWWKGRSDSEKKRKDDVFKSIDQTDPKARLRFLQSQTDKEQERRYKAMSPYERAELRMKDAGLEDLQTKLDGKLSIEERDKTDGARKHVASYDGLQTITGAAAIGTTGGSTALKDAAAKVAAGATAGSSAAETKIMETIKKMKDMKDEHLNKIDPDHISNSTLLKDLAPAKIKRYIVANEDKINTAMASTLATEILRVDPLGTGNPTAKAVHDQLTSEFNKKGSESARTVANALAPSIGRPLIT